MLFKVFCFFFWFSTCSIEFLVIVIFLITPTDFGSSFTTPFVCLFFFSFQYTQVSENDLISLIKNLVSEKLGIPAVQQRLVFKGKTLAGNYRLHYNYFTLLTR